MAKTCMYCGLPLAKEDARFCNECGRLQIPTPADEAGPSPIRVKLPPKEFSSRDEPPPFPSEDDQPAPGFAYPPRREAPAPASQPPRLPKRPVRLTTQESATADRQSEMARARDSVSSSKRESGSVSSEQMRPAPAEELSTMVLPGWREELEQLRKDQPATSSPVVPEKRSDLPRPQGSSSVPRRPENNATPLPQEREAVQKVSPKPQERSSTSQRSEESATPSPQEREAVQKTSPKPQGRSSASQRSENSAILSPRKQQEAKEAPLEDASTSQAQRSSESEERATEEQARRELRVRVWERESTIQYPQVHAEKEGPAPAVEHSPFASVSFDQEVAQSAEQATVNWQTFSKAPSTNTTSGLDEELEQIADQATASWQTFSGSPSVPTPPGQEAALEKRKRQQTAEVVRSENDESVSDVEDLPTVPLAVPEAAKRQPPITIERASTPAPTKRAAPQKEEIEDLPTMPMAASPASPRSPIPPVAPQPSQGREQGSRETRPASSSIVTNPLSQPGVSGSASIASSMNAAQTSGAAFGASTSRGPVSNPHSQAGSAFDSIALPPLPQGPASLPGNFSIRSEASAAPPRPSSFAPSTPPPLASGPAEGARQKKRVNPVLVVVLILLVLGVSAGAFTIYYQSTSGSAQAYQLFQSNALGVSLNYPQGWTSSINRAQTSVHFADSSQTGQITLSTAVADGQQESQYLNQKTTQLGISGPQSEPATTFAGTSWQQVQGRVVQNGATYTIVLYVTQHGVHYYALAFLAPPSAYKQMEQENFAPLRASFRFL